MKTTILCFLLVLTTNIIFGQTAYIQVNGEAGLSVFLNGQFKGKTTIEYNGLIVENVTAGKNLIKIVKEGFTPFEEYITVKPGEVFSYKVKPFTKHLVKISEQGNSGETDSKAAIKTGNLIIQSVPIEIKISIPEIEGVDNLVKTKDKWLAEKIPEGTYAITFTFNQKVINKTIEIVGNDTVSIFINMLNGEFNTKSSLAEKQDREKSKALKDVILINYINNLGNTYKFKPRLTENQLRLYNIEADKLMNNKHMMEKSYSGDKTIYYYKYNKLSNGLTEVDFNKSGELIYFKYTIISINDGTYNERLEAYKKAVAEIESLFPKELIKKSNTDIIANSYTGNLKVTYSVWDALNGANTGSYSISFEVITN